MKIEIKSTFENIVINMTIFADVVSLQWRLHEPTMISVFSRCALFRMNQKFPTTSWITEKVPVFPHPWDNYKGIFPTRARLAARVSRSWCSMIEPSYWPWACMRFGVSRHLAALVSVWNTESSCFAIFIKLSCGCVVASFLQISHW
jgi:hypothetical protein